MTLRNLGTMLLGIIMLPFVLTAGANAADRDRGTATAARPGAYHISGLKTDLAGDGFVLRVQGPTPPAYTMYEMFDPLRIILDIADASFSEAVELPLQPANGPVAMVQGRTLDDQEPAIARLEILLAADSGYTVARDVNDIVVAVRKEAPAEGAAAAAEMPPATAPPSALSTDWASVIYDVEVDHSPTETRVFLRADGPIRDYRPTELEKDAGRPARMFIDIKNLLIQGPPAEKYVGTSLARIRLAQREKDVRIVFDSDRPELFPYHIMARPDGLAVVIKESSPAAEIIADLTQHAAPPGPGLWPTAAEAETAGQTGGTTTNQDKPPATAGPAAGPAAGLRTAPPDNFAFAGYNKQPITVDFYKIDLHNVFRLFKEISGLNIVVDESVSGSLTLSLNNVPWDFALDIILNLKDLQKEERFNTLVILPKSKAFSWPKTAVDNLAIMTDAGAPGKKDALTVRKQMETPREVLAARNLTTAAITQEKAGNFNEAAALYEQAFAEWPANGQLAVRLAYLYLIRLDINPKAVHYARAALKVEKNNSEAALYAAIGSANMQRLEAAREYFDLAVSGPAPPSEALLSYAVFLEENNSYAAALSLLERHELLYGEVLDAMLARARIFDKIGEGGKAAAEYRAILHSGYETPADLKRYIQGRLALENQ